MDGKQNTAGAFAPGGLSEGIKERKENPGLLVFDFLAFVLGFLFSGQHFIFGAYPLALAFVAASPAGVFFSAAGGIVGSLLRSASGTVDAILIIIALFLRVIVSGGVKEKSALFRESLILRISTAVIASFIGALYTVLYEGFNSSSILYGLASTLLCAGFCFVFSMLYDSDVRFSDVLLGTGGAVFKKREGKERYSFILFCSAFVISVILVSVRLNEYEIFGIGASFVFSSFLTLFFAKRFGAVKAMAIGFISSFATSVIYSPGFALLGLVSGLVFSLGESVSVFAGGAALGAWSAFSGGTVGFLSTMPEFALSAALFFPFSKALPGENKDEGDKRREAFDMVSAEALSHKGEAKDGKKLSSAMEAISARLASLGKKEEEPSRKEIADRLVTSLRGICAVCPSFEICRAINPAPCVEIVENMSTIIYKDSAVSEKCCKILPSYCQNKAMLFDRLCEDFGNYFRREGSLKRLSDLSVEYELIAKMIKEAKDAEARDETEDLALGESLRELLPTLGLSDAAAKVIGERKKRVIIAGNDKSGEIISSKALCEGVEALLGVKLAAPSYYRRGEIALLDAATRPLYTVDYAKASVSANEGEVSGDTLSAFTSPDGYFYSIVSDGMGTGPSASDVSVFASDTLSAMLLSSVSDNTAFYVLNRLLRNGREERSVALDVFRFDLFHGEAMFIKSGAASSFVLRETSLFRVRSECAPLGLMRNIDAERVRVEVKEGDRIIMMSDGVLDAAEARIFEILSAAAKVSLKEAADAILEAALAGEGARDDCSVSVMEIQRLE